MTENIHTISLDKFLFTNLYKFLFTNLDNILFISVFILMLAIAVYIISRNHFNSRILERGREGPQPGRRPPCTRDRVLRILAAQFAISNGRYLGESFNIYHARYGFCSISPSSPEGLFLARHSNRVPSFILRDGRLYEYSRVTGRAILIKGDASTILRIRMYYPRY